MRPLRLERPALRLPVRGTPACQPLPSAAILGGKQLKNPPLSPDQGSSLELLHPSACRELGPPLLSPVSLLSQALNHCRNRSPDHWRQEAGGWGGWPFLPTPNSVFSSHLDSAGKTPVHCYR